MATKSKSTTIDADFSIFKAKVSDSLLAQAVYVYQANSHQNTSRVKTRGEIRASKRKIYKQKGTGRARHGALSAPIFVGGGVAHGPTGVRRQRRKLNTKMKSKALLGALSILQKNKVLGLLKLPSTQSIKTKKVISLIPKTLKDQPFTLVQHQSSKAFLKALANIPSVRIIPADQLNAYQVLQAKHLLFTPKAFEVIKTRLQTYL
jgi:large subunit ribosomal protein L4